MRTHHHGHHENTANQIANCLAVLLSRHGKLTFTVEAGQGNRVQEEAEFRGTAFCGKFNLRNLSDNPVDNTSWCITPNGIDNNTEDGDTEVFIEIWDKSGIGDRVYVGKFRAAGTLTNGEIINSFKRNLQAIPEEVSVAMELPDGNTVYFDVGG
jgi:hypothetical protein